MIFPTKVPTTYLPSMKTRIAALLLLISSALWSQNRTLSGYITDIETGEALIGVNIWSPELKLGTSSNTYGFYSSPCPKVSRSFVSPTLDMKAISLKSP